MADTKQSALTPRGTPNRSTDTIMVVNGSSNYVSTINNELGISGNPVGDTDSQTLTNKTLTSPTISGPALSGTLTGTYTIGGTPTFPSSIVTLTGSQTLTNKTLTSPTLTSPTLTNASITQDSVVGYTTANSGTVYGVAVTSGSISGSSITAGSIGTTALATNAVQASQLATNAISLGYQQITTPFITSSTTPTLVTGLTVSVTIPSGGRKIKITAYTDYLKNATAGNTAVMSIWDGSVGSGTQLQAANYVPPTNAYGTVAIAIAIVTPSSGSKTYNVGLQSSAATAATLDATATSPAFILVEVI